LNKSTQIIAVASGKGGVGKSTVSSNLAIAISKLGSNVGLLDADIYGPSIPRMFGLSGQSVTSNDGKNFEPIEINGIQLMSIGFVQQIMMP
jgi:ATP-binding protein involved in chromosome partitioning